MKTKGCVNCRHSAFLAAWRGDGYQALTTPLAVGIGSIRSVATLSSIARGSTVLTDVSEKMPDRISREPRAGVRSAAEGADDAKRLTCQFDARIPRSETFTRPP